MTEGKNHRHKLKKTSTLINTSKLKVEGLRILKKKIKAAIIAFALFVRKIKNGINNLVLVLI